MKKLTDFLKNFAIDYVIKYLTDNKDEVVAKLNKEINVPILNEKQEKELLDAIYDTTVTVVKGIKQMLPAMIIKAVVPKVLELVLKQFKGIEKINSLVEYMEKPNEADKGVKEIKQLLVSKDLKIHELEMRIDNYENQLLELAKKVDKIKK